MAELVVVDTTEISERGLALFFQRDPDPIPTEYRIQVQITRPDQSVFTAAAQREFARKVPPGEVIALLIAGVRKADVPVGSTVAILGQV